MPHPGLARSSAGTLRLVLASLLILGSCTSEPDRPKTGTSPPPVASTPVPAPPDVAPGAPSAPSPVPVVVPPPPVPGRLVVTTQSPSEIALSWIPAPPAGRTLAYELLRGDVRVVLSEETRAVDRNLKSGTRYCYSVRTVDVAAGQTSAPCASVCTRTLDTSAPTPPLGVKVTARPGNVAELSWSPSTDDVGVTAYEVFRAEERVASVEGTVARDERLTPGKEYCWKVTALDAAGNRSAASDPACATLLDTTPPTVPARVTANAAGERMVDVAWEASQDDVGVVRYEIRAGWSPPSRRHRHRRP